MASTYVVTGGARGVGRAIAERLAVRGLVVIVDRDADALRWTEGQEAVEAVAGDAAADAVLDEAVRRASGAGTLMGWVNNAAIFSDASVHDTPAATIVDLISANLGLAVAGSAAAIRAFLAEDTTGAVVNVSSHQAQRAVPGALPYATAKAAIEGLTRALAVDYASRGIRVNAVARSGRSSPNGTTTDWAPRCADYTHSGGSGAVTRWPRWSITCCPQRRASSPVPSSPSTAGVPHSATIRKHAT